jgi:hypothetical protein
VGEREGKRRTGKSGEGRGYEEGREGEGTGGSDREKEGIKRIEGRETDRER